MTVSKPIAVRSSGGGGSSVGLTGQRKMASIHVVTAPEIAASSANIVGANLAFSEETTQVWFGGSLLALGVGGDARFDPATGNLSWSSGELLNRIDVDDTLVCEYQVK